jgi:DNA-binding beta-propeller fold protein YncE
MDPPFKFKRGWGAYGKSLKDITPGPRPAYDPAAPPSSYKDFLGHVTLAIAGNEIYVADRSGDRVQVFTKDGKFVREFLVAPETRGRGSAGGLAPSKDPQQRYLYVSDIMNNVVWIVNRQEGKTIGRIGFQGHSGGGFRWLHMVATDSKGNVYTGEVDSGKRIQKFVPRR